MNSVDFEGLHFHFMNKVSDLQKLVEINIAVKDDHECMEYLEGLETEMGNLQSVTSDLRRELQKKREAVCKLQETDQKLDKLIAHLNYTLANIPERLPKPQESEDTAVDDGSGDANQSNQKPSKTSITSQKSTSQLAPPTTTLNQSGSGKQTNTYYPEIEYLKVEEFNDVPKYIKGRITYDQVNKFIDGINTAYVSKYKLLRQKKSSLSDLNRKRYEKYKSQETKDTADEDLKDFGNLKIDNVARSIQTLLRHCKRVREVRGGRITRIVYVDSY